MPTTTPPQDHDTLRAELLDWIARAYAPLDPGRRWPRSQVSRADFAALARRVLAFQSRANPEYARYCQRLEIDIDALDDPLDAPAVPTDAFKRPAPLTCFDPAEAVVCFRSSGTTRHDRGRHYIRDLTLMRASITPPFRRYMMPDHQRMRLLILAPPATQAPESSLYFMLDHLRAACGDTHSDHFIDDNGELDIDALGAAMRRAVEEQTPVFLMGPSFAFVHLLDARPSPLTLPGGSRLFETGGFKGKSRVVTRAELHAHLHATLGIPPNMIAGEYGMSELSSQLYEPTIRHTLITDAPHQGYVPPPWCAARVVDPQTLRPSPIGEVGLIALLDLANLGSVAAILTGDLGRMIPGDDASPVGWHGLPEGASGLALLGRARGAAAKGCSLALDMMIEGDDG